MARFQKLVLHVDVSRALGGRPARTAHTVWLPDPDTLSVNPLALCLYPGGRYSRNYFDIQFPGFDDYSEAAHHAANGFIVIMSDHPGTGDSSAVEPALLDFATVPAANDLAIREVLALLEKGEASHEWPPIAGIVPLALGQSMGGALLTVQQARYRLFSGVGLLGWSGIQAIMPTPPNLEPLPTEMAGHALASDLTERYRWAYFWENTPEAFVHEDIGFGYPRPSDHIPMWGSHTAPEGLATLGDEGAVAKEAATIDVPLLIAAGQRDVVPDPWAEPVAYRTSNDITVFVLPESGHMHNFSNRRKQLWSRIECWARSIDEGVPA